MCTLDVENNPCRFLAKDGAHCNGAGTNCGFKKEEKKTEYYIRAPRWYENLGKGK